MIFGKTGHAYNISNPDSIRSIRDIAEIMSMAANVELKMEIPSEAERKAYAGRSYGMEEICFLLQDGIRV